MLIISLVLAILGLFATLVGVAWFGLLISGLASLLLVGFLVEDFNLWRGYW